MRDMRGALVRICVLCWLCTVPAVSGLCTVHCIGRLASALAKSRRDRRRTWGADVMSAGDRRTASLDTWAVAGAMVITRMTLTAHSIYKPRLRSPPPHSLLPTCLIQRTPRSTPPPWTTSPRAGSSSTIPSQITPSGYVHLHYIARKSELMAYLG